MFLDKDYKALYAYGMDRIREVGFTFIDKDGRRYAGDVWV